MVEEILKTVAVMGILAVVLGLLLAIAGKYMEVKVDPRIEGVTKLLPGANCGACGCAGCADLAKLLVNGEKTSVSTCKVIKADNKIKVKDYLDNTPGPDGACVKVTL